MNDPCSILGTLRRPPLLVRAAQFGLTEHNRERSLRRLLPENRARTTVEIFAQLVEKEAWLDEARRSGEATYSISRHIEVLAALIIEARLVKRAMAA